MDIKLLTHLYENTDLTQREIATQLGVGWKVVWRYCQSHFTKQFRDTRHKRLLSKTKQGALNPMNGKCGDLHHNYIGRTPDCKGYMLVLKPEWYTGRAKSKHMFEHNFVVCLELGITEIPKRWCVHHCDGNKVNNSFDNLVLLPIGLHSKLHHYLSSLKGVSTISKESTLKWAEAQGVGITRHDIVKSIQECIAAKAATA